MRKLVQWDLEGAEHGTVQVPMAFVARLMENLSEAQARELGRWVGLALLEGETGGFGTSAPGDGKAASQKGRAFSYEVGEADGRQVITLRHAGGAKWAAYYLGMLSQVLEHQFGVSPEMHHAEGRVVARLPPK